MDAQTEAEQEVTKAEAAKVLEVAETGQGSRSEVELNKELSQKQTQE